jgi:hypothetical protein
MASDGKRPDDSTFVEREIIGWTVALFLGGSVAGAGLFLPTLNAIATSWQ